MTKYLKLREEVFVDESVEHGVVAGGGHGECVADKEGEVVVTEGVDWSAYCCYSAYRPKRTSSDP